MTNKYMRLKYLRVLLGIKQKDLASEIDCNVSSYSKKENGLVPISISESKKISDYINKKLTEKDMKPLSMESIFFNNEVPDMEQKEG